MAKALDAPPVTEISSARRSVAAHRPRRAVRRAAAWQLDGEGQASRIPDSISLFVISTATAPFARDPHREVERMLNAWCSEGVGGSGNGKTTLVFNR